MISPSSRRWVNQSMQPVSSATKSVLLRPGKVRDFGAGSLLRLELRHRVRADRIFAPEHIAPKCRRPVGAQASSPTRALVAVRVTTRSQTLADCPGGEQGSAARSSRWQSNSQVKKLSVHEADCGVEATPVDTPGPSSLSDVSLFLGMNASMPTAASNAIETSAAARYRVSP